METGSLQRVARARSLTEAAAAVVEYLGVAGLGAAIVASDRDGERHLAGDPAVIGKDELIDAGHGTVLRLRHQDADREPGRSALAAAGAVLAATATRLAAEEDARIAEQRLADTERIGGTGSYDWDIRTDTNRWSDQLYLIYGHQPQSFNASYDRFIGMIHPDDRDRIRAIHMRAYETGEPYEMEERIVRPDGEERLLWSNGEVVQDEDGRPIRMVGVCRDVTEERRAALEAERATARFVELVEAAPDAVLVIGLDGTVQQVNQEAERLFGGSSDDLVGRPVEDLLPPSLRDLHREHRATFHRAPARRSMAAGQDLEARRLDGSAIPVDIGLTPLTTAGEHAVAAFVRDATARRRVEAFRQQAAEAAIRQRQALELNDNVVQGLVSMLWSLERDGPDDAVTGLARSTLEAARSIMADLLTGSEEALEPGSLVRTRPARVDVAPVGPIDAEPVVLEGPVDRVRVLIADDAADLRLLLRHRLRREERFEVVAEACDGAEAVDLAVRHQPDVVVLDLSMPRLDGLQAAQRIRSEVPEARIVVLSGYPEAAMREQALAAGAVAYVEKDADLAPLCDAIRTAAEPTRASAPPR